MIAGGELLRKGRVKDARREFEAALELRPEDPKAMGLVGLACFQLQDYDEALATYRALVTNVPNDASYRLNLGLVYLKLGKADEAIDELRKTREIDPGMSKALDYLGLAYARAGHYLHAYEAFKQTGQEELASEMKPHLSEEEVAAVHARLAGAAEASATAPAPAPEPEPAAAAQPEPEPAAEPEAAADDEPPLDPGEASGAYAQPLEISRTESESDAAAEFETEGASGDAVPMPAPGAVSEAVQAAIPSGDAAIESKRAAIGHRGPVTLSQFATSRLIRPDDGDHPFEISAGGVLIVRVQGKVMSRTEGVIVSGGELAYEPATRRVRGAGVDESFGGDRPMFIVTGDGHLVASPLGNHFAAVSLDDDVLYLREDLVFAFEERLRWENGYVPGSDAKIAVVQFRGTGCVATRTSQPTLAVKLSPDRVLYVDADALAGWVGRVVPRVVAPAAGGEASALFVECSGEGVVLLEDEEASPQEADAT